jgi:K+-sensing histidine kinase KdpD
MESDGLREKSMGDILERFGELSHDLKTPLTSLRMSVHLLQEDPEGTLTPAQRELLATAAEDVERLHALIVEHLDKPRRQGGSGGLRDALL